MRYPLFVFLSGLFLATGWYGCKKEVIEEIHLDTIITNNDAPPYSGVSDVQVTNYINKLHIDLVGRAPTQSEISDHLVYLETHNLSDGARDTMIQQLIASPSYYKRLFDLTSDDFINGMDSSSIAYEIQLFHVLEYLDSINGNIFNLVYYQNELNRLAALQHVTDDYMNGSISVNQFFAAFLNNYFYDQVNMGSENFVKGAFSDLFLRAPTESELSSGVSMVDNVPAILFLMNGSSKGNFITIVTSCSEFYEGLVLKTYRQVLLRDPDSEELNAGTLSIQQSGDFPAFEKQLMKTIEYAGF